MSFLRTLKRAFGFGGDELDEEELEGIDATVVPLNRHADTASAAPAETPEQHNAMQNSPKDQAVSDGAAPSAAVLPSQIFETVVRVFNESLPPFLRDSADEQKQRDILYNALDESMKQYLQRLAEDARERCNAHWASERSNLQQQVDDARARVQKEKDESSESKKQQLSAERQKRALGERVRDLETQLAKAEAENEQLSLENKSMANKLRVSAVLGADISPDGEAQKQLVLKINELTAKLDTADAETESLRQALNEARTLVETKEADLKKALDEKQAKADEADAFHASLGKEEALRNDLQKEVENLRTALEQSRAKDNLGDAMLTDLNSQLGRLRAEHESLQEQLRLTQSERTAIQAELDKCRNDLNEANGNLAVVEEMHLQLTRLEDARKNNETFLRKQKDELLKTRERVQQLELENAEYASTLQKKDGTIHHLEELTDSLRKTIENNVYEHAQSQSGLRAEIERLKRFIKEEPEEGQEPPLGAGLSEEPEFVEPAQKYGRPTPDAEKVKRNRGKEKTTAISAIDESIEDTDWLIATPPPQKTKADADNDNPEFGYKAPVRKQLPDNPAQMLLFD